MRFFVSNIEREMTTHDLLLILGPLALLIIFMVMVWIFGGHGVKPNANKLTKWFLAAGVLCIVLLVVVKIAAGHHAQGRNRVSSRCWCHEEYCDPANELLVRGPEACRIKREIYRHSLGGE